MRVNGEFAGWAKVLSRLLKDQYWLTIFVIFINDLVDICEDNNVLLEMRRRIAILTLKRAPKKLYT